MGKEEVVVVDVVVQVAWAEAWDWGGRRRRRGERLVVAVMVMLVVVERIDKEQGLRVVRIRRIRIIMVEEEEERMVVRSQEGGRRARGHEHRSWGENRR